MILRFVKFKAFTPKKMEYKNLLLSSSVGQRGKQSLSHRRPLDIYIDKNFFVTSNAQSNSISSDVVASALIAIGS